MRQFLILVLFMAFAQVAFGATAQVNNVTNSGGANNAAGVPSITTPVPAGAGKLIMFSIANGAAAGNTIGTFQRMGGTSVGPYQVTAGKTLALTGCWGNNDNGAAITFSFGQSTGLPTSGDSWATAAAYAGSKAFNSSGDITSGAKNHTSGIAIPQGNYAVGGTGDWYFNAQGIEFTAAYYPWIASDGSWVKMHCQGYEY